MSVYADFSVYVRFSKNPLALLGGFIYYLMSHGSLLFSPGHECTVLANIIMMIVLVIIIILHIL